MPDKKLIWSLITHLSYIEGKHGKTRISEIIWPCLDDADLFSIKSFQFPHKLGKKPKESKAMVTANTPGKTD